MDLPGATRRDPRMPGGRRSRSRGDVPAETFPRKRAGEGPSRRRLRCLFHDPRRRGRGGGDLRSRRPRPGKTTTMAATVTVRLPDGSAKELATGSTAGDLAAAIGSGLARAAVAAVVDGREVDLSTELPDGAEVAIL